jgi:hypothetical protein
MAYGRSVFVSCADSDLFAHHDTSNSRTSLFQGGGPRAARNRREEDAQGDWCIIDSRSTSMRAHILRLNHACTTWLLVNIIIIARCGAREVSCSHIEDAGSQRGFVRSWPLSAKLPPALTYMDNRVIDDNKVYVSERSTMM